ncbi:hypothetical protein B0H12DRAFT_749564 [Mycena haematopus]|nr:hypothetical protein B0H12DRAFT_749564 [Mycena haematopus]
MLTETPGSPPFFCVWVLLELALWIAQKGNLWLFFLLLLLLVFTSGLCSSSSSRTPFASGSRWGCRVRADDREFTRSGTDSKRAGCMVIVSRRASLARLDWDWNERSSSPMCMAAMSAFRLSFRQWGLSSGRATERTKHVIRNLTLFPVRSTMNHLRINGHGTGRPMARMA